MIIFPSELVGPAKEAGISVPPDPDNYKPEDFVRFNIFCKMQLGQTMPNDHAHWDNAKIIARIPKEKLKTININELIDMGFQVGPDVM
jgi:hypothetical protein